MPTDAAIEKALASLKLRDRVVIEWIDAHNLLLDGWVSLDYLTELDLECTVRTLGHFILRKGDFVLVAGDVLKGDDVEEEFNSTSAIPVGCITHVEAIGNG